MDMQYTNIKFGTAGWSYKDWEGIVYGRKENGLETVSSILDCVEINNTFYRIPEEKMVSRWLERTEEKKEFSFLLKLWKGFTHEAEWQRNDEKAFQRTCLLMKEGNRLGAVLAQFPFYFTREPEHEKRVWKLSEAFRDYGIFFEFRHISWLEPDFLDRLKTWGGHICNIDIPGGKKTVNTMAEAWGGKGYLRLHGRNRKAWFSKDAGRDEKYDYLYSEQELEAIIQRLKEIAKKANSTFVIANNHFRGKAVANALQMKASVTGRNVEVPEQMIYEYPVLKRISHTQSLF
jgi:uncharacterized protein YecE (DUF72 family)